MRFICILYNIYWYKQSKWGFKLIKDRNNKCINFDCYEGTDRGINQLENGNTHEELSKYTHEQLEQYTHSQLEGNKKVPYIIFSEK